MAYDCINGWEDMIEALSLDLSAEGIDCDDAQEVATLALDRIAELQRAETAARAMLAALRDLHDEAGRRKLDVRRDYSLMVRRVAAEKAIAAAEAAGITTTVEG